MKVNQPTKKWENYIEEEGSTPYEILIEKDYKSMVKSFKDHQHVYNNTQKYSNIKH